MKLVEILAREWFEWPINHDGSLAQNAHGGIYIPGSFRVDGFDAGICMSVKQADDWRIALVTRAQWEAERARIAAEEAPTWHIGTETEQWREECQKQYEQERTEFPSPALLKKLQTSTEGGAILVDDYAGGYDLLTEIWRVIVADEAARRAPAVPAPQGWKPVPVEPTQEVLDAIDLMADDHRAFDDSDSFWRHLVAAAPQPPEAAQLDDIGVVDMAQAVDSKEAAPVQLPDCAGIYTVEPDDFDDDNCVTWRGGMPPARGTKLYTEHQVRQLLAARGIEEPQ